MSDPDDLVKPSFHFGSVLTADFIEALPKHVRCIACNAKLMTIRKNVRKRRLSMQVHVTRPPTIVDQARYAGELACEACGARTPIDLRLFGAVPRQAH